VIFGKGITTAAPGSVQGTFLVVSDVEAARAELVGRGAEVSDVFHFQGGLHVVDTNGCVPGAELDAFTVQTTETARCRLEHHAAFSRAAGRS